MRIVFLLCLIVVSGCATSVCVDNLNISEEQFVPFPERPALSDVLFDRTISHEAEPYVLKAFAAEDGYYLEFYPVRSQSRLYGPYEGDFHEQIRCE